MLVELFGPPAAGKTTLAKALATAFQQDGRDVELVASSRPAERCPTQVESQRALSRWQAAVAAPLSRGAKLVSALPLLLGAQNDVLTANLLNLMPPRTFLWSVRSRRYLTLLSSSWQTAATSDAITIFDQGFLTALCSLALLAGVADRRRIRRGVELIPRPDLLIHLDAPRQTLEARLRERLARQGPVERLFEFDLKTNLKQIGMTNEVVHMLRERGLPMVRVTCLDDRLQHEAVARIMQEAKLWHAESNDRLPLDPCLPGASRQGRDWADHQRASAAGDDRSLSS